jgi:hypothetical protein
MLIWHVAKAQMQLYILPLCVICIYYCPYGFLYWLWVSSCQKFQTVPTRLHIAHHQGQRRSWSEVNQWNSNIALHVRYFDHHEHHIVVYVITVLVSYSISARCIFCVHPHLGVECVSAYHVTCSGSVLSIGTDSLVASPPHPPKKIIWMKLQLPRHMPYTGALLCMSNIWCAMNSGIVMCDAHCELNETFFNYGE